MVTMWPLPEDQEVPEVSFLHSTLEQVDFSKWCPLEGQSTLASRRTRVLWVRGRRSVLPWPDTAGPAQQVPDFPWEDLRRTDC